MLDIWHHFFFRFISAFYFYGIKLIHPESFTGRLTVAKPAGGLQATLLDDVEGVAPGSRTRIGVASAAV